MKFQSSSFKHLIVLFVFNQALGIFAEPILQKPSQASSPNMVQNKYSPSPEANQWANRGVDLAAQGDYPAAIENLFEAWKLNPEASNVYANNLSIAHNNYAKSLIEKGKKEEALNQFRRAVFFNEDNKTPANNLDVLFKDLKLNPNDFQLRLSTAQKLRNDGFIHESVAEYLKALSLAKTPSAEEWKTKLELAQIYQVLFSIYASNPVGKARFDRMQILCKQLINANNKDLRPYLLLGRANLIAEQLPSAIEAFEGALKINPKDGSALEGLIGAWKRVVEIAPNESANQLGLSNALMRAGFTEESNKYLQKAKALDPKNPEIEKLQNTAKELDQESELVRVAERALEAQKAGKYDQAIDLYKIAINKLPPKPEYANIYYNLGLAYQAKGQTELAINAFNQSIKLNPNNQDSRTAIAKINQQALANRKKMSEQAVALQAQGKLNEAIALYQKFLKDFPNDAQTHFNLGTAYQEQNKMNEALQEYKNAVKLAPENKEFKEAVNSLETAINSGAFKSAQARDVLQQAVSLQESGKLDQAITKYQEALRIDSQNGQIHFNLATAYHSKNKLPEAISEYKESYKLDPANYPEANYFVASLLESQAKSAEAILFYKRYLEDQPNQQYSKQAQERINALSQI